jgi:hypothetical protein
VWWEKSAGKWAKERDYKLLDLKRLPEGQWYATKEQLESYHKLTWNLDFQLLQKNEFPPDIFNGDKLLNESRRDGTVIESY